MVDTDHQAVYVIICVSGEAEVCAALQREVQDICGAGIPVKACACAQDALALTDMISTDNVRVPLIITGQVLPDMSGVDLLLALHEKPGYRATRKVLLSAQTTVEDLARALEHGALQRTLPQPWERQALSDCVRALLTSFLIHHGPEELGRFAELVDTARFPRAYQAAQETRQALNMQLTTLKRSFLANMDMTDEQVERAMGAAIDEALDNPPRRSYKAGTVLLREDEPVDSISILLDGHVQLSRTTDKHEVILHTHSAGPIIGLLALAGRGRAFFTCRAITDVTVLPLTLQQLDVALQSSPWLTSYFVTTLIRSMARRSIRTAQLKQEIEELNRKLRAERDELADALDRLEHAQTQLVESEKMATLGQLTAGVAHELNNPVAAIRRAAEFIGEDLVALVADLPDGELIQETILSALRSTPTSTREMRKRTAALSGVVGDNALTHRLAKAGITTPEAFKAHLGSLPVSRRAGALAAIERYHALGTALRNLQTCSERIAGIVDGLRSYARPEQGLVGNVDVHEGLEDTLRLLDHTLRNHDVKRSYGELPRIECRPGELNQVWTNLISNAVHAMGRAGTLRVETDTPDPEHVRVKIIDSGKGIAPDVVNRIFDLHFTTKGGRVEFGLGMGLPICRHIVTAHGGTIAVESEPGRTYFNVVLPVSAPRSSKDETSP
ncbi:MAG: cyclic nucleotide-binding domain-containing protein [Planctomycetes bacterium]|nr:cyclic nucleotide-binding domain-containing protein [Planctomycetota bacterium]